MKRKVLAALFVVLLTAVPAFAELPAKCQFVSYSFGTNPWYSAPCDPGTTCSYQYGMITYDADCHIIGIDEGAGPAALPNGPVAVGESLDAPPLDNWSLTNVSCPDGVESEDPSTAISDSSAKMICRSRE